MESTTHSTKNDVPELTIHTGHHRNSTVAEKGQNIKLKFDSPPPTERSPACVGKAYSIDAILGLRTGSPEYENEAVVSRSDIRGRQGGFKDDSIRSRSKMQKDSASEDEDSFTYGEWYIF